MPFIPQIFIKKSWQNLFILMDNLYFSLHALAKWSEFWSDKLKLDVNLVLSGVCFRHLYLNFEEEHQLARDSIFDLKKVLLMSAFKVIN